MPVLVVATEYRWSAMPTDAKADELVEESDAGGQLTYTCIAETEQRARELIRAKLRADFWAICRPRRRR